MNEILNLDGLNSIYESELRRDSSGIVFLKNNITLYFLFSNKVIKKLHQNYKFTTIN